MSNYESFIAGRIIKGDKERLTRQPVIRLAIASMSLGVCVMIVTIIIVSGFKKEITQKVSGFAAHIQVTGFDANNSMETPPLSSNQPFLSRVKALPEVRNIQVYARKAGILKTKDEFEGVVFKGVAADYDFQYINEHLINGKLPLLGRDSSRLEALISQNLALKLHLKPGSSFLAYFLEEQKKVRRFYVSGIYNTGLADEFDNIYVFCDLQVIRKLNDWKADQISGFEVYVKDFKKVDETSATIYKLTGFEQNCKTVKEIYPQIFNWLQLQDINVLIIVILMVMVAGINMISTLLIIILENTLAIGILKSLGASSASVRRIFLRISLDILSRGLVFGNLAALLLGLAQKQFRIIKLPQESYYVSSVPIDFNIAGIILINAGTIIVCMIMLIVPSGIISRLSPAKVIQFE